MKKQTTADKIRQMTKQNPGMNAKQIADSVGSKIQYVHTVWYLDRKGKKTAVKRKIGRPRKVRALNDAPVQGLIKEVTLPLNKDAQDLRDEVANLRAIVRYLEGRLYGASV
jgi:hypothetical protein